MSARPKKSSVERERKFLIEELPAKLSRYSHSRIEQGYLAIGNEDPDAFEIRIRRRDDRYTLTAKKAHGEGRLEKEVPLPVRTARSLWPLTKGKRIQKTRYEIPFRGLKIELDVYHGEARGLAVAEVEFPSAKAMRRFEPPVWFGREVTGQKKFSNAQLASRVGGVDRHKKA